MDLRSYLRPDPFVRHEQQREDGNTRKDQPDTCDPCNQPRIDNDQNPDNDQQPRGYRRNHGAGTRKLDET
jgi:hypothetical protein